MSIQYKMILKGDNLNPEGQKKESYHPLVVRANTLTLTDICKKASKGKSLSAIEIEMSVRLLFLQIEAELNDSNHVCLEGFGTFSLTAKSRAMDNPEDIRAESIFVKRVIFVPSKPLMNRLKNAQFVRYKKK